jgi:hypothetical protein
LNPHTKTSQNHGYEFVGSWTVGITGIGTSAIGLRAIGRSGDRVQAFMAIGRLGITSSRSIGLPNS